MEQIKKMIGDSNNIKITALIFLIFVFTVSSVSAGENDWRLLTEEQQSVLLNKLSGFQRSVKTFQGDFVEQRSNTALKSPIHYKGRLFYNSEGLFFMHYLEPVRHILRVKGGEALFFVEDSTTADVVDISNMQGMANHSSLFVWNPDDFKGRIWENKNEYRLEDSSGKAGQKEGGRSIKIYLDRRTLLMQSVRIEDGFGDVTLISLSNQRVNEELPFYVLNFSLPDGTKINRMNNLQ